MKRGKKWKIACLIVLAAVLAGIAACGIYVGNYYHADEEAMRALSSEKEVTVFMEENGNYVFSPGESKAGLIFYPGGKVEHTAYAPLMRAFAEEGIFCVLVEMPFRLAVLDMDAAAGIQARYPEIEDWYIGGHSLGGSMAASYVAKYPGEYSGLLLLASYSTTDLKDSALRVLSIYGSNDGVLNRKSLQKYRGNLPQDAVEYVIEGGCHAYFGSYGPQKGDGEPSLTPAQQIEITVGQSMEKLICR